VSPLDDGAAIHYLALEPGTPVYSVQEERVGKLVEVLDNAREQIFDGIVIELADGSHRFVDAPEVARTAERAVTLTISAEQVAELDPPSQDSGSLGGLARRLFRGS
jgi:hypothetical protein